jgi:fatty acid desaturase
MRSAANIALDWGCIALAISLSQHFWCWPLYLLTVAIVGARQHALLILMHDAAHGLLFTDRRVNEWVAELLLAWPLGVSMVAYRRNHLAHHRWLSTARDPDFVRKAGEPDWQVWHSVRDLSGLGVFKQLKLARNISVLEPPRRKAVRLTVSLAALSLLAFDGLGKAVLLYWLVPWCTWLVFVMRLRSIGEHRRDFVSGSGSTRRSLEGTRTVISGPLGRIFILPHNVGYHAEHHENPGVPFYRLPELQQSAFPESEHDSVSKEDC